MGGRFGNSEVHPGQLPCSEANVRDRVIQCFTLTRLLVYCRYFVTGHTTRTNIGLLNSQLLYYSLLTARDSSVLLHCIVSSLVSQVTQAHDLVTAQVRVVVVKIQCYYFHPDNLILYSYFIRYNVAMLCLHVE